MTTPHCIALSPPLPHPTSPQVTDGLGIFELLTLAEGLGTVTQMSVFTGYSMGQPYVPLDQSQQFAQDAVDMIDFAKGDTSTTYGKIRADMGHPKPFAFTRMEVSVVPLSFAALPGPGPVPPPHTTPPATLQGWQRRGAHEHPRLPRPLPSHHGRHLEEGSRHAGRCHGAVNCVRFSLFEVTRASSSFLTSFRLLSHHKRSAPRAAGTGVTSPTTPA